MNPDHRDPDRAHRGDAGNQLVESIAEDGTVLEIVTRQKMRADVLRHRSVFVVVRNSVPNDASASSDGHPAPAIVVHKRADWKDYCPGAWDLSFGGVCDPGESWIEAALRELAEEAGVKANEDELIDLGPVRLEIPNLVRLLGRAFVLRYDGSFSPDDGEVSDLRWLPIADLDQFIANESVTEDSATFLVPLIRRLG